MLVLRTRDRATQTTKDYELDETYSLTEFTFFLDQTILYASPVDVLLDSGEVLALDPGQYDVLCVVERR